LDCDPFIIEARARFADRKSPETIRNACRGC